MYAPDPQDKKFDFENIDTKLYLALRAMTADYKEGWLAGDWGSIDNATQTRIYAAELAMEEFELSHGPIPDWATGRNWAYELVPGAQLCTKDGRRTGNAHIVKTVTGCLGVHDVLYECLTDAGSKFIFTEAELLTAFSIGDWISDPARIIRDFDRNNEFKDQPDE